MRRIRIEGLTRRFGDTTALDDITLEVEPGEFFVVLGASGCGKSTLLRLIAGLDRPDAGRIVLGERTVADPSVFVEGEARGVGVVFQSYALWPHMDVAAHARFPLQVAGIRGAESERVVAESLQAVGLTALAARTPAELSGGQRQRFALARCLAQRAGIILMDEPLANLDPHLRTAMEGELARVQRDSGATVLYITHDQREAMALADRIAVLDAGRVRQVASPQALYREPADAVVAGFVGEGSLLAGRVAERSGFRTGDTIDAGVEVAVGQGSLLARAPDTLPSGEVRLLLRPEAVRLDGQPGASGELHGRVRQSLFRGSHHDVHVQLEGGETVVARSAAPGELQRPVVLQVDDAWAMAAARDPSPRAARHAS